MHKRRWTIIVVPQGSSTSRLIEVSHTAVKLASAVVLAAVLAALLLGYGTITKSINISESREIAGENARLAQELGLVQGRVGALSDSLLSLEKRDSQMRLLANLEPIAAEVHAAGIGGPVPNGVSPTADPSLLVSQASAVRVDLNALLRRASLLTQSFREAADSLSSHTARLAATPSILPTQGWLTSAFAAMREHPVLHVARPHEGVDITAPAGTPIEAPANGKVVSAGWETGYGNTVVIDHGYGIVTRFAHASRLLVTVGNRVQRGQRIALVGHTGLATGPHLHYEVHVNGRPVNPLTYVLPDAIAD